MKRLIVPPLPAASRPSKTMTSRSPVSLHQAWSFRSSTCSWYFSRSYALRDMRFRYGYAPDRQPSANTTSSGSGGLPHSGSSCASNVPS